MRSLQTKLIRLLVRVLAILPLFAVQAIGSFLGRCAWFLNGRSAKVTRRNLELCFPALDETERRALARQSMAETGKTLAEMGKVWLAPPAVCLGYINEVSEDLDLDAAFAKGKGVIAIAPHLGNWELLNLYAAKRFPLNVLYQPPKMIELDGYIRKSRTRMGTKIYPTDRRGVVAMYAALRKGEVVGILPDQEPPITAGVFAPFFGIDSLTMTLVSKLANKTGAQVVCAYAKRLPMGQGFNVVIRRVDSGIYTDKLTQSVAALNRSIEGCVVDAVEQYQWEYKRFKTGWSGKTGFYKF